MYWWLYHPVGRLPFPPLLVQPQLKCPPPIALAAAAATEAGCPYYAHVCFPRRFGMMPAQMKALFDATGGLWVKGSLVGKPAGVFVSVGTQVRLTADCLSTRESRLLQVAVRGPVAA